MARPMARIDGIIARLHGLHPRLIDLSLDRRLRVEGMSVPFGGDATDGQTQRPGGDHERSTRACKRATERLDDPAIHNRSALHVSRHGEVVPVREMDHPIRGGSRATEGVKII